MRAFLLPLLAATLLSACASGSSELRPLYDECIRANECRLGGPVTGQAICQPLAGFDFIDRAICTYECDPFADPLDPDRDCLPGASGLVGRCDFPPVSDPRDAPDPVCLERCDFDGNCAIGFVCDPVEFDVGGGVFETELICVPE